jgi:hypothetical protein
MDLHGFAAILRYFMQAFWDAKWIGPSFFDLTV